jgi:hypothetical protein
LQQAVTEVLLATTRLLALNNRLNDFVEIEIAWNNGDADTSTHAYQAPRQLTLRATTHKTKSSTQGLALQNLQNNAWLDNTIKPSTHDIGDYYDVMVKDSGAIPLTQYATTCM